MSSNINLVNKLNPISLGKIDDKIHDIKIDPDTLNKIITIYHGQIVYDNIKKKYKPVNNIVRQDTIEQDTIEPDPTTQDTTEQDSKISISLSKSEKYLEELEKLYNICLIKLEDIRKKSEQIKMEINSPDKSSSENVMKKKLFLNPYQKYHSKIRLNTS